MWFKVLLRLVLTLLVCSIVIYGSIYLTPGDAVSAITGGRPVSEAVRQELAAYYRLDDPFLVRYFAWLAGVLQGDLGTSTISRLPVSDVLAARIPVTLALVAYASLIISIFGVSLGVLAAARRGWLDTLVVMGSGAIAAFPAFVASIFLLAIFAVQWKIFPSYGAGKGFWDGLYHLTLPAIALAIPACGYVARVTRSTVLAETEQGYVEAALSRGLTRAYVFRVHVLRNALLPILTTLGVTIASLIAGSVVVEQMFSINGLGRLLVQSVTAKDTAVVLAVSMIIVTAFVVLNVLIDALHSVLDPRVMKRTSK